MNHPDIDTATSAITVSGQPQELQMYVTWSIMNELYGLIAWLQSGLGMGASMIGFAEASREDLIDRETADELSRNSEIGLMCCLASSWTSALMCRTSDRSVLAS